ncbi:amidohydrolase family protein [Chelativorans xinjiangense]|uniref:amidohydrolase family protein n=1 Tax=Chelativorans xinjiangense TaxID=2681485 RepID=UPI00135B2786|nr:amidohydrolase/deacetylase family metallohydrolase [Chelativorans xinjiangense]
MALLLRNFRLVGFGDASASEIAVGADGSIAAKADAGARIIDCGGAWLSPGWADLHVHVWHGGTDISIRADEAGLKRGVTAMADAGSAGEATFHGLREYVIERQRETIKAFVNIGSIGLVACNRVPELIDERFIDVDRTLAVIEKNRDVVCGVKVRSSGVIVGAWGITPLQIGKRVAEIAGLPLMVHIGEPPPVLDQVLDLLSPGDVVTHCFNGKRGGSITDTEALFAHAKRLAEAGVRMDIGHGAASYSFTVAKESIRQSLKPFSISTDLHGHDLDGPVFDLATTASKLLAAGLSFEECVDGIAANPRAFLGLDAAPLAPGSRADFTVFDLADSDEEARDSQGNVLRLEKTFEPRLAILGAVATPAARAGREGSDG